MPKLRFEITTGERVVHQDDDVDMVVAPGVEGAIGILPRHAPLVTMLQPGELRVHKGNTEQSMVVSGGFMEVTGDRVLILADSAERIDEIDLARAEQARQLAQERLANRDALGEEDVAAVEAALRRSLVRLRIARRRAPGNRPGQTT